MSRSQGRPAYHGPQPYSFIEQMHKRERNYNVSGRYEYINAVEEFDNDEWSGNITFDTPHKPKLSELSYKLFELECGYGKEAKVCIGADYIFAVEYPVLFDLNKEEEIPSSRGRKADWYWGFKQAVEQRIPLIDLLKRTNTEGKETTVRTVKADFEEGYIEGCIYIFEESDYCKGVLCLIKRFRGLLNEYGKCSWWDSSLKQPEREGEAFQKGWEDARQMIRLSYDSSRRHGLGDKNIIWGSGKRIDRFFESI